QFSIHASTPTPFRGKSTFYETRRQHPKPLSARKPIPRDHRGILIAEGVANCLKRQFTIRRWRLPLPQQMKLKPPSSLFSMAPGPIAETRRSFFQKRRCLQRKPATIREYLYSSPRSP